MALGQIKRVPGKDHWQLNIIRAQLLHSSLINQGQTNFPVGPSRGKGFIFQETRHSGKPKISRAKVVPIIKVPLLVRVFPEWLWVFPIGLGEAARTICGGPGFPGRGPNNSHFSFQKGRGLGQFKGIGGWLGV